MKTGFSRQLSELNFLKNFLTRHELFNHPLILRPVTLQLVHGKFLQEEMSLAEGCKGFVGRFGHCKTFTSSDLWWSGGNPKTFWFKFPPGGFSVRWKSGRSSVAIST
jgi:hypothetical protein